MNRAIIHIISTILLTLTVISPVRAQYYSTNFDYETIAAMVAGYGTQAGTEMMYQQNTSKIAESYGYSEVASAGIFASKLLDRNALKSTQGFGNPDENYYYKKIYRLVANKIIPRTVSVTEKLVKEPSTSLYWGSHLLKVMADTKSLCEQFSTVVTNSTLNFNDIPFLAFNAALQQVFDLQALGNFRHTLENLADIGNNFTTENIEKEFDNLQNLAVGLAGAGSSSIESVVSGSAFDGTFRQKVNQIAQMVESNTAAWNNLKNGAESALSSIRNANLDDITAILTSDGGNGSGWISHYSSGSNSEYYTQRVYIYTTNQNSGNPTQEFFYEETYDSYSLNWDIFMNRMNARLADANRNDNGKRYYIGYDAKHYYTASNARKLAGATQANFITKCEGTGKIADGNIQYKCNKCGSSPNNHTKECAMQSSLSGGDFDFTEINNAIESRETEIANLQQQIDALNAENKAILDQLSAASSEEAITLRTRYNANRDKITALQSKLDSVKQELNGLREAKNEAIEFENSQSDTSTRIPSIMHELQSNFQLEWMDEGTWQGYTFIRKAKMRNLKNIVTFKATVSISRGPKYFLGIKIHRAIVKIAWELDAEYSDSQIVETMQLEPNADAQQQADKVNQRLRELQRDYPDCTVTVEYEYSTGYTEDNDDDDKIHLLWASDRLDVAREICHRLETMYVDLVVLDKFLHYKYSIIDWLKDMTVNKLHTERGRRLSIAQRSRRRWMHNAGSSTYDQEDEDGNYE